MVDENHRRIILLPYAITDCKLSLDMHVRISLFHVGYIKQLIEHNDERPKLRHEKSDVTNRR